jgi:hypothetical protein
MANLKAVERACCHRSGVLLGSVECKISTTSTWPISIKWPLPTPLKPTRIFNLVTMHSRMLGSVLDARTFLLLTKLMYQCVPLLRSRPLLSMASLKAIGRTYLHRSGVLLDSVECKTSTTSTCPIRALWTITLDH